jgi:hypothetical protein
MIRLSKGWGDQYLRYATIGVEVAGMILLVVIAVPLFLLASPLLAGLGYLSERIANATGPRE